MIWKRTVPAMAEAGMVLDADRTMLELFCSTAANVEDLEDDLAENGYSIDTPNGLRQPSPSWSQLRQARETLVKIAIQLGLSPKSRKQLGIVSEDTDGFEGDFKQ
ncbi:hypothetical protein LCGC14_2227890 [marine sediment metagenome]|uniref:Phage terminase small subunit P27 family n=1 Tax=marine sediment metagenome TaxID=412755 RepID=A0A0F9DWN8_9ZZZZ